jgi:hypothetical protein
MRCAEAIQVPLPLPGVPAGEAMSAKRKNYAEEYMKRQAVRNEVIAILTNWWGSRDGEGVIGMVADEILAIDPAEAFKRFMQPKDAA